MHEPESSPDSVLVCGYLKHLCYRIVNSKFGFYSVLGIRDILVRIRIPGFVPLTNVSDFFLHGF
jgi:hypothetical protein